MKRGFLLLSSLTCQKPSTASHTNLLIAKLSAYVFDRKSIAFISAYLKNQKQKTRIGPTFSECLKLNTYIIWCPTEGSILGPLLFLFIADLFYLNYDLDFASYADGIIPLDRALAISLMF